MLAEKLPKLSQHFTKHGVDPALFTLNWFLCVFVDTVPVKTYLHIWDAFLFEGSKEEKSQCCNCRECDGKIQSEKELQTR